MLITHSLCKSDRIVYNEIFNEDTYANIRKCHDVKEIIDIGASFGGFVVYAKMLFPDAHIQAFEPAMMSYLELKHNISINHLRDVDTKRFPVWKDDSVLSLHMMDSEGLTSLVYASPKATLVCDMKVKCIPIDDIIGDKTIDILKIDCEGAEYEILMNSKKLDQVKFIIGEYHDYAGRKGLELRNYLRSKKFRVFHRPDRDTGLFYAFQD